MTRNHSISMHKTIWITGDQCSTENTALKAADKNHSTVLMIESVERGRRVAYHKHKLVLIYSVMRHFAQELESAGWKVAYYKEWPTFAEAVRSYLKDNPKTHFSMMTQSEFGANERLQGLVGEKFPIEITPHCNFVSTAEEFQSLHRGARVTMEYFYRLMRKKTGLLMELHEPIGGQWNFDKNNRQPLDKSQKFFRPKAIKADAITVEVEHMVEKHFADHPGSAASFNLAVTRHDALARLMEFVKHQLDQFGPSQDAMKISEPYMNHSVLSPYINTCLLHPLECARMAEQAYLDGDASLESVEGFIRQLIGWREFVWQVYWQKMPAMRKSNTLSADINLPRFFNTGETKMACMSEVINQVIDTGYAHHIQRLMILGNFSLIAGLVPEQVNDWFWAMFVDGYDWVMIPNVIGMSLHADGGYVGTKPYAASANYINKMSDYCKKCPYDLKDAVGENACPFNTLYWDFLDRNRMQFTKNHRMSIVMKSLASRPEVWLREIRVKAKTIRSQLRENRSI